METKKLAATFAILMIALGVAGFAYAHWEKIVTIDGTVGTGTLHVTPSFYAELIQDKPVATIEYMVYPEDNAMDVWLDDVYPCLVVDGWIDLENDGTIPVNLVDVVITLPEGVTYRYNPDTELWEICEGDKVIATFSYELDFPDVYPQIDPGCTAYIYFSLHFEEDLTLGTSYEFHIELVFWNWNEA